MNPLRIVIVEDEAVTARDLAYLIMELDDHASIVITLSSVQDATLWFNENPESYDLIFMDIRLSDGLSFEIFSRTHIRCPVIFVTAYNNYAIQAFKNNGIGYILKPFDEQEVKQALDKYKHWIFSPADHSGENLTNLIQQLSSMTRSYKSSFLIHFKDKLIPLETAKMAWFFTENELVYVRTLDDRQYIIEFTMEQIEQQVDPRLFFRANRQYIIQRRAVEEVDFYFNGRLSVNMRPKTKGQVLISKARAPEFKSWMNS